METIEWHIETGMQGAEWDGEIEVEDDATDDEIQDAVREEVLNIVSYGWRVKEPTYRRAEIVAQASRLLMTAGAQPKQSVVDLWSGALMDWMNVTGKLKYDTPARRGRAR